MILRVDVVRTTAQLDALEPEWDALYDAAGGINPFLRWRWVKAWWASVQQRAGQPRTRLHILALRDADGQLRGVVPLFLGDWHIGPLGFRVLRLYGIHTTLTDVRSVLISSGWEMHAAEALAHAAGRRAYDVCVLDGLPRGERFSSCLATTRVARRAHRGPELPAYTLPLPGSWDELRARLTRNNRGSIQQGYNALKRDNRRYQVEEVTQAAELPGALDELLRLHAARAAHHGGPRHHDYYVFAQDRAFLRTVVLDFAARGLAAVCRLRVDGRVVASRVVLAAPSGAYLYHAGHDPAWDRYRVGTLLTTECIQLAIQRQAACVHLGTGTEPSKLRWNPELTVFDQLHLSSPTLPGLVLGEATWGLAAAARRLRAFAPRQHWLTVGGWRWANG
jgi:CelD/BcsL family acetyltransferase involved in cellulose biosynthesis